MSVIVLQHHLDEGPCLLGVALRDHGMRLEVVKLYAGEGVPEGYAGVDGVISMGGPMNVREDAECGWMAGEMEYLRGAHERGIGIVGVCLGSQMLARALGGEVGKMDGVEVGMCTVEQSFMGKTDPILSGIRSESKQMHMHGFEVKKVPAGGAVLAGSDKCAVQAFKVGQRSYGFQYHFEWGWDEIEMFSEDELVERGGVTRVELLGEAKLYYEVYRRLGDRLAKNLALYLFGCGR